MGTDLGVKLDTGKAPVFKGLFSYFPKALLAVAEISHFGSRKYTWGGWRSVEDGLSRYTDALGRHLLYEAQGEEVDPESELLHAAHAAWNALARLEIILNTRSEALAVSLKAVA